MPILDLRIKCGSTVQDISLWREEALSELYVGDMVELSHLKATITQDGKGKFASSNHTTVKVHNICCTTLIHTNIQNRVAHIDWLTFNGQ